MPLIALLALFVACKERPQALPENIDADKALEIIKEGNQRFMKGRSVHPNVTLERAKQTAEKGQKPFVTVLSCADSRVPVEAIFDRGIGDVFTVRVAGNVSDTDEIGTIEYGTEHLGTPLLVVIGHSKCGAVTAVAKNDHVGGSIPQLVDNIVPAVKKVKDGKGDAAVETWINEAIKENVWQSISDLLTHSGIIRELVTSGKLKVVGGMYHLDSGEVEFMGMHPSQAELIKKASSEEK
jgi:carbonic anhydrase